MGNTKENKIIKISLAFGVVWLIGGIVLTMADPKNLFFTIFLGLGIFFATYSLKKTQILL